MGAQGKKPIKEGFLEEVTPEPNLKPSACAGQKKKGVKNRRVGLLKAGGRQVMCFREKLAGLCDRGVVCMQKL